MARRIRSASLETRTTRLKLPVRKKSYFATIARGIALGYRRNQGAGTWSVRAGTGHGKWLKAFATADDHEDADGQHVLTFWQAQDQARSLARATDGGGYRPATIGEALDHYAADLRARGGDPVNATRVRKHIPAALAAKAVSLLGPRELRQWRDGLVRKGLERGSADRTARALKAALSLAARDDPRIANSAAWRTGLARLPDGERVRNVVLPEATVRLLVPAAYEVGRVFGAFTETVACTGTRTSQALAIEVRDLQDNGDDPRLTIPTSRKGRNRRIERKPAPITSALAAILREVAGDRPGDALLFDGLVRPGLIFTRMVARLGLNPEITLYSLRHSNITRLLLSHVPVRVVAALHDTSTLMIERTYSRYIADHSDALVRRALLQPEPLSVANIVPLKS